MEKEKRKEFWIIFLNICLALATIGLLGYIAYKNGYINLENILNTKSEKVEEAGYLEAKSYSMLSPSYSLDQIDTVKAIDKLQTFIDTYPESAYLSEANAALKKLTDKLEKKYYEIAKQYNTISDHKAALVALDLFIDEYPGTQYKEAALFYRYDSAYKLAINSVPSKMEDRLRNAKIAYNNLVKFKENTTYKQKADDMLARIEKDLQQYSK